MRGLRIPVNFRDRRAGHAKDERVRCVNDRIQASTTTELHMNGPAEIMELFFHLMGGLGLFFTGVGVLWFVSVYKEKSQ